MNVALLTNYEYPSLTASDRLLISAFNKVGIEAKPAIWNDPAANWSQFDYIVLRSCWGYYRNFEHFKHWLSNIERQGPKLLNPLSLVEWNLHKKYLLELQTKGIQIPDTTLIPKGDPRSLDKILANLNMALAVVKPCVGASAHGVMVVKRQSAHRLEAQYRDLVSQTDILVQPFIPEIKKGEYSAVFIGNKLSHVVLKTPLAGEFRSNGKFGGTEELVTLDRALKKQVEENFSKCGVSSLYARLDFVLISSDPVLMELELIEPDLFFKFKEHSANLFVSKFKEYIEAKTASQTKN